MAADTHRNTMTPRAMMTMAMQLRVEVMGLLE
jgi:hypothetical protein